MLLSLLAACVEPKATSDDTGAEPADTDTDTDTDADADTDTDTDTGSPPPDSLAGVYDLEGADGRYLLSTGIRAAMGGGDLDGDGTDDLVLRTTSQTIPSSNATWIVSGAAALGERTTPDTLIDGLTPMAIGDLDGDGAGDLFAVGDGTAYVFCGPILAETLVASDACLYFDEPYSGVIVDLNGDGSDDLAVSDGGRGLIFNGPLTRAEHYVFEASATIDAGEGTFGPLANAGDVDGDGVDDLIIPDVGVYVRPSGELALEDAYLQMSTFAAATGDFDGDGVADVAVFGSDNAVAIYFGPLVGELGVADALLFGHGEDALTGVVSPGDVNGDGRDDLLVSIHRDYLSPGTGGAYLFTGRRWSGSVGAASAEVVLELSGTPGVYASIAPAGDVDQDGYRDMILTDLFSTRAFLVLAQTAMVPTDLDRDGFADECDDTDPAVHPGATEDCTDGVDNDCDGAIDLPCNAGEALTVGLAGAATQAILGAVVVAPGDLNGDGVDELIVGAAPTVANTAATLYVFDDGRLTGGTSDAAVATLLPEESRGTNLSLNAVRPAPAGDLDGDGVGDLAVSLYRSEGGPVVFLNLPEGTHTLAEAEIGFYAESDPDQLVGRNVFGVGDLTGDGADDLWVATVCEEESLPDSGAGLFAGPLAPGQYDYGDAYTTWTGTPRTFGAAAVAGDLDGDGVGDLLALSEHTGGLYVYNGPLTSGEIDASGGEDGRVRSYDRLSLRWAGDVDGDGLGDVLAAAPETSGSAWVFGGAVSGSVDLSAVASRTFLSTTDGDELGLGMDARDLDGDGVAEVLLGAPSHDGGAIDGGAVALFRGGVAPGVYGFGDADAVWLGDRTGDQLGRAVATADLDGDGVWELLFGAPNDGTVEAVGGVVYLASWP